jgi:nucleoid-associated protein YgaU
MFFQGSRYEKVDTAQIADATGQVILYKKVRFIPATPAVLGHTLVQGERLDQISHSFYKDAQRFWRIADANYAMWPDGLVSQANVTILIPPSEG